MKVEKVGEVHQPAITMRRNESVSWQPKSLKKRGVTNLTMEAMLPQGLVNIYQKRM